MKKLVTSLLKSIPELLTVVAFLLFLFFLYGVVGIQMWSGVLHPRCRLTPSPVRLDPSVTLATFSAYEAIVLANPSLFPCIDDANNRVIPIANATWTHESSPWHKPRLCYWPLAPESPPRTCSLSQEVHRLCPNAQVRLEPNLIAVSSSY